MTLADAKTYVKLKTDNLTAPAVTDEEVETILSLNRLADSDGNAPDDDDWAGVYDLNRTIAEVFEMKSARSATQFDFSADGASYKRHQTPEYFDAQATKYRNMGGGSVGDAITLETDEVVY